jgi:hypothetical protein
LSWPLPDGLDDAATHDRRADTGRTVALMPRLAAIRRFDRPSALSRRTSRIFRIGNLSWDIPLAPFIERERGHADSRITQRGSCTRPRYSHPRTPWSGIGGRHQAERGWTSPAGIGSSPTSASAALPSTVGRLHREHHAKREVIVYDYVDSGVPLLARMALKRQTGYRSLGYEILTEVAAAMAAARTAI